jgi:hypothetical protein
MSHPEMDPGVSSPSWRLCFLLVTDEGTFLMKTQRWLLHAHMQTSGSVGGAHRKRSTGTVRAWEKRGIVVLALLLGSLGAAASASPGNGHEGHVQATAHQSADSPAHAADADSTGIIQANRLPWMY